ncbi:hypothetical protein HDV00_003228 [Rhizophlyctis rosea]|nr:hypothetical protein HDV00_003228 [Rhizophlyctis rosea]
MEFEIDSIVKYSHNRGKQTFTFSYMDADGLLSEYKLLAEKYFEIFEALGRAIATVIKIKSRSLIAPKAPNASANLKVDTVHPSRLPKEKLPSPTDDFSQSVRAFASLSNLTEREEAERSAAYKSLLNNDTASPPQTTVLNDKEPQRESKSLPTDTSSYLHRSEESLSNKRPKDKKRFEKAASWFSFDKLFSGGKRSTDRLSGSEERLGAKRSTDKLYTSQDRIGAKGSTDRLFGSDDRVITGLNDVPTVTKPEDTMERSRSTDTKVALAKFYMESRYRTMGLPGALPADTGSISAGEEERDRGARSSEERRWKQQVGLGGFSNRKPLQPAKSESSLSDAPITRTPLSEKEGTAAAFRSTESLNMSSSGSLRMGKHASYHGGLASRKGTIAGQSRNSVMTLFGQNVPADFRTRTMSENPKDAKYSTVSGKTNLKRPTVIDRSRAASEKPYDKYATVSGMKKLSGTLTTKKAKRSSVFPTFREGEFVAGSGESIRPPVVKSVDESGKEILIKNLREDGYEITAGTVDALVDALIDDPDLVYLDIFLMTFRHFISPVDLISKLAARYRIYEVKLGKAENERAALSMNRIVSFVKKWVGEHFYDFLDPQTLSVVNTFLEDLRRGEFASYADQIDKLIKYEMARAESEQAAKPGDEDLDPEELRARILGFDFLNQSSKKMAQQLTLSNDLAGFSQKKALLSDLREYITVDSRIFRAIRPEEFAIFLWGAGDQDKQRRTRNLQRYIDSFNLVGYWVATVIVCHDDLRKRIVAMEKIIKIATWCLELQNYNTAMAIFSGLNTTPVLRLKKTMAGISGRHLALYQDLESKMSYKGNYKAYREIEHMAKPPYLPFFGLVIKDLTFMNDGNQKTLPNGLVNFEKQRMIFNIITGIRTSQRFKFPFVTDEGQKPGGAPVATSPASMTAASYCSNLPCLSEEQLMTLSKLIEPPGEGGGRSDTMRKNSIFGAVDKSPVAGDASTALLEMIAGGGTIRKKRVTRSQPHAADIHTKKETPLETVVAESDEEGNADRVSRASIPITDSGRSSRPSSPVLASESEQSGEFRPSSSLDPSQRSRDLTPENIVLDAHDVPTAILGDEEEDLLVLTVRRHSKSAPVALQQSVGGAGSKASSIDNLASSTDDISMARRSSETPSEWS